MLFLVRCFSWTFSSSKTKYSNSHIWRRQLFNYYFAYICMYINNKSWFQLIYLLKKYCWFFQLFSKSTFDFFVLTLCIYWAQVSAQMLSLFAFGCKKSFDKMLTKMVNSGQRIVRGLLAIFPKILKNLVF